MKNKNFQQLKKFLIRNHKGFSVKSTYADIEEYLYSELSGHDTCISIDPENFDYENGSGIICETHRIEIDQFDSKSHNPVTFEIMVYVEWNNGQGKDLYIEY